MPRTLAYTTYLLVWVHLLRLMLLRHIHIVLCISICVFPFHWWTVFHCKHVLWCVYSPVDGHWVVSHFWLLRIMLLYTFMYRSLCDHIYLSFLLGKHLDWECWVTWYLYLWEFFKLIFKIYAPGSISTNTARDFQLFYIFKSTL